MSAQLMVLLTLLLMVFLAIWLIDGVKPAAVCLAASICTSGLMYSLLSLYACMGFRLL